MIWPCKDGQSWEGLEEPSIYGVSVYRKSHRGNLFVNVPILSASGGSEWNTKINSVTGIVAEALNLSLRNSSGW